jgi:protein-tyrosine phosphatase
MSSDQTRPPAIVDLHSHLVPGVDDGAATVEESLQALASLFRQGVRVVVTTPHLLLPHLRDDAAIGRELAAQRRGFEDLVRACATRCDLPILGLGQEIWAPDAETVRRVAKRQEAGLNGDYLLVEFGFRLSGSHSGVIQEVLDAGRKIVVAHPERYTYLPDQDPLELMEQWRRLGALLQVNVGSLSGHYQRSNPGSEQLAWRMVDLDLIDLLASDHHGPRRSGVSPAEAWDALVARGHAALAERLMVETPGSIVSSDLLASRLPR